MEIELIEIRDFIAKHPPFDLLNEATLNDLPKKLTIRYFRQGSAFPDSQPGNNDLYVVRSGAIEIRNEQQKLIDKLAEGDVFLAAKNPEEEAGILQGVCIEDALVYVLGAKSLKELQDKFIEFNSQFNKSLKERLRSAVEMKQSEGMRDVSAMRLRISELTDRHPVIVDVAVTIHVAAKLMVDEKVSSILITKNDHLIGLMTDRDIKTRCVAAGLDYNNPVSDIMSSNLETLSSNALLSEALLLMTRKKINHVPVMEGDKPTGMLTTSDVVRHLNTSPAFIASDIYKAKSVDALVKISSRLPELQLQLSLSSLTAKHIGEVFSSITDAVTCRLLELGEKLYGTPPVHYVWVAAGSQARNEQTSHSDQDNALIISDDLNPEDENYFNNLANFVCDGLDACGYEYCPGDAMASNNQWRQTLNGWMQMFSEWINTPEPKALMLSSIFFDMRPVFGDFLIYDVLQKNILSQTKKNEFFISHMVGNALTRKPPLGFFRNFVMVHDETHKNTLDIKHRGIVPIVDLARIIALDNGISEKNTTERLEAALKENALSKEMHDNLIDALEYIGSLKIRHQSKNIRSGIKADNYLPPDEMSGIEKNHLKDAFSIIKTMQIYFENLYTSSRVS